MKGTFFTNSFNRLPLLQNMLRSFDICNQSADVEWIITDYGSTDGSREWLQKYSLRSNVPCTLIYQDETDFFKSLNVPVLDRRTKVETILRKYRNQAREAAQGDYLFDIGSDHQFIRPADFITEIDNVFNHRQEQNGYDDLSGVFIFGYFRWRLKKKNNALLPETNRDQVPYFVAHEKAYVDYSTMKQETIAKVGPFLEVEDLEMGSPQMEWWSVGNHLEMEYMNRCQKIGLKRAILKYPFSISFANDIAAEIVAHGRHLNANQLIAPLWTLDHMRQKFGYLTRPVASEDLFSGVRTQVPLMSRVLGVFG